MSAIIILMGQDLSLAPLHTPDVGHRVLRAWRGVPGGGGGEGMVLVMEENLVVCEAVVLKEISMVEFTGAGKRLYISQGGGGGRVVRR